MPDLIETAIERLRRLPADEQERFARDLIERIEDESRWDKLTASAASQDWLARQAAKVRADRIAGKALPIACEDE
jgi:hypothetical protein